MTQRVLSMLRTHDDREIPVAGRYVIDPSHSTVEFVARHLMISNVRGRIRDVAGVVVIDDEPELSNVDVQMQVDSLNSGDPSRDAHLLSADFLNVARFPTIGFSSTGVEAVSSGSWRVTGQLTVRDVTRPLTLDVEFDGGSISPFGDEERIAFSATAVLDREDWGLIWNVPLATGGVLVGRRIRIEISVQAVAEALPERTSR